MRALVVILLMLSSMLTHAQSGADSVYVAKLKRRKFDIQKYSTMNRQHMIGLHISTGDVDDINQLQYFSFNAATTFLQRYRYKIMVNIGAGAIFYRSDGVGESTEFMMNSGLIFLYGRGLLKLDIEAATNVILTRSSSLSGLGSNYVAGSGSSLNNYLVNHPMLYNYRRTMPNVFTGIYLEPNNFRLRLKIGMQWYFNENYANNFFHLGANYAF